MGSISSPQKHHYLVHEGHTHTPALASALFAPTCAAAGLFEQAGMQAQIPTVLLRSLIGALYPKALSVRARKLGINIIKCCTPLRTSLCWQQDGQLCAALPSQQKFLKKRFVAYQISTNQSSTRDCTQLVWSGISESEPRVQKRVITEEINEWYIAKDKASLPIPQQASGWSRVSCTWKIKRKGKKGGWALTHTRKRERHGELDIWPISRQQLFKLITKVAVPGHHFSNCTSLSLAAGRNSHVFVFLLSYRK
eukprot:scaffold92104_cov18-Tisochrysis_lutea.AAC.1